MNGKTKTLKSWSVVAVILTVIGVAFFTGCATAPRSQKRDRGVDMLPEDQMVYMLIDVSSNLDVLTTMTEPFDLDKEVVENLLQRTTDVAFSLFIRENGERDFTFIAFGKYPKRLVARRLSRNPEWVEHHDSQQFWFNPDMSLSLAVPDRNSVIGTNGNMERLLLNWSAQVRMDLPRELRHELEISDLVFFMPRPGESLLDSVTRGKRYPIELIWITLFDPGTFKSEDTYYLSAVFFMKTEEDAGKFSSIAKLLTALMIRNEGIGSMEDLKNKVEVYQDGNITRIRGITISREDLIEFLKGKLIPRE